LKGLNISRLFIPLILTLAILGGCRSLPISPNADNTWVRDLNRADAIVLDQKGSQRTFVDPETISRLADVYAKSKWETYWHTLPSNLGERTIDIYLNGSKIRRMSYTGVLWEHNQEDSDRTTPLDEADRAWLESLFDSIQTGNGNNAR
jgi:hypothetical protein